jgi:hypothetical protein
MMRLLKGVGVVLTILFCEFCIPVVGNALSYLIGTWAFCEMS